jgi:prolyl oligopeptidase
MVWLKPEAPIAIPNLRAAGNMERTGTARACWATSKTFSTILFAAAEYLVPTGTRSPRRLAIQEAPMAASGGCGHGAAAGSVSRPFPATCRFWTWCANHLFGSEKPGFPSTESADVPEQFRFLFAYSPYHHVKEGVRYPALLMMTADSDTAWIPMHRPQNLRRPSSMHPHPRIPVLLRVETQAGHGGGDMVKKAHRKCSGRVFPSCFINWECDFSGGRHEAAIHPAKRCPCFPRMSPRLAEEGLKLSAKTQDWL